MDGRQRKRVRVDIGALAAVLVAAGCVPASTRARPRAIGPGCSSGGQTPLLDDAPQADARSLFAGARWNDPSVVKVNGQFWMYASADHDLTDDVET